VEFVKQDVNLALLPLDSVLLQIESVESIVVGGIAFATPETASHNAKAGHVFDLHNDYQQEWLEWQPEIALVE
jgi:paraquat-inducible protein B